ncbi:MAG: serine/threonine protein kinase [Candidatus Saganbacteria bacterium]|nr:serine/threonine protein kinase [Candidatus Saganbacteria bacterium]
MPSIIDKIDRSFQRLLASRHPVLKAGDKLFKRAFGGVPRLTNLAPAGPIAGPQIVCMSAGDRDGVNQVFDLFSGDLQQQIEPGKMVKGQYRSYQVVSHFAEGGMADIYLVRNAEGQELLLKKLKVFSDHSEQTRHDLRLRFNKEVSVLREVSSPYVVKVFDIDPQPLPMFYIMEKIEGKSLFDAVPQGKTIDPHLALVIMIQILDGLIAFERAYQKQSGSQVQLAHRDIKPENILLRIEGRKVKGAVLTDFGIVKLPESQQTKTHEIMGTPGYLAPEAIIIGGTKNADQRADIFALGAVLYWLFTGVEPFAKVSIYDLANRPDEIIKRLSQNRPPFISPDMWSVTFRAMSPRPELRFQSYTDMRQALYLLHKG